MTKGQCQTKQLLTCVNVREAPPCEGDDGALVGSEVGAAPGVSSTEDDCMPEHPPSLQIGLCVRPHYPTTRASVRLNILNGGWVPGGCPRDTSRTYPRTYLAPNFLGIGKKVYVQLRARTLTVVKTPEAAASASGFGSWSCPGAGRRFLSRRCTRSARIKFSLLPC